MGIHDHPAGLDVIIRIGGCESESRWGGPGPGTRPREQEGRSADSRPAEPYPGCQYLETAATTTLAGSTNSHNHLGGRPPIWHDWLQLGYRNEFRHDWDRAGSLDMDGAGGRS